MNNAEEIFIAALDAWDRGKLKEAFALFLESAKQGYDGAQLNLGYFYDEGEGVPKNKAKALYWYKKAWRNGQDTCACWNIAKLYAEAGRRRRALYWWKKAVDLGDGEAALDLAKFLRAEGNKRASPTVARLLKFAAESKHITPAGREEAEALIREQ